MTNLALNWPVYQGVNMEPDRIGAVAQLMADQPTRGHRIQMAQRLEKTHGREVAIQIRDRATEILRERQKARAA